MSRLKRKIVRKKGWKPGVWKLIDDFSGFEIQSCDAYKSYLGYYTSKANWDPVHYTYLPVQFPKEGHKLPFIRPAPIEDGPDA